MPSAVKIPGGPIGRDAMESIPGWLSGKPGGLKVPKAPKFRWTGFRNPFAAAPKKAPKLPGVTPNPVQAGDDVVRAVQSAASPAASKPPLAGRTFQYVRTGLVTAGVVGGAVYGPGLVKNAGDAFGSAAASAGAGVGDGAGAAAQGTFSGLGAGLADLFAGTFAGAGQGVGVGVGAALAGVGEGLKKVALPAAALGVGFLIFTALKKK